ncbi:pyridoxal kinase PdxY [Derxia gummosa]|uniref:pyridoxal kinase n=1 Tax=Derxia gummosa DSM 723 TaxID=1121388 RepID=A0A8B6X5M7_9BURK|nr:pyridoxal kinase PdxY [Derxia gummosa]
MNTATLDTATPPLVLSIQSHVACGHVGNAAAVFPMQRLGIEPLAIHTVQFSNHTGHGAFTGQVFTAEHVRSIVDGLRARGMLARCRAVLSGYLGDAAIGEVILDAVREIREARGAVADDFMYCCDPVIGDVGRGVFVREGITEFQRDRAVPMADVITPNQFEFEQIVGRPLDSTSDAAALARSLGPRVVVITSLRTPDVPAGALRTLCVAGPHAWKIDTPYIDIDPLPNGMGDVFSAVFLGMLLHGARYPKALSHAVRVLYALVSKTPPGSRDLPLVAEQNEIVWPSEDFEPEALPA